MSGQQGPKQRHHFLPQLYLKGFAADGEVSRLWEFTKGGRFRPGPENRAKYNPALVSIPKKAGMEIDGYALPLPDGSVDHDSYENQLAQLEKPCDEIIRSLRRREPISASDKALLAAYMVLMIRRVPAGRQRIRGLWPEVAGEHIEPIRREFGARYDQALAALTSDEVEDREKLEAARTEVFKLLDERLGNGIPREMELDLLVDPDAMPRVVGMLRSMSWQVFVAPDGKYFVTSDNPVHVRSENGGLNHPSAEVVFPISRDLALVASHHPVREAFKQATSQEVNEINRRVISQADRYVYSPKPDEWIHRVLAKREHRLGWLYWFEDAERPGATLRGPVRATRVRLYAAGSRSSKCSSNHAGARRRSSGSSRTSAGSGASSAETTMPASMTHPYTTYRRTTARPAASSNSSALRRRRARLRAPSITRRPRSAAVVVGGAPGCDGDAG
jgi:hypothetical protein